MEPDIDTENGGTVLRCACCGMPWAYMSNGVLTVESRHGGRVHVNRMSVSALAAMTYLATLPDRKAEHGAE